MPDVKTTYFCSACGTGSLRWEGRCPACGEWNALVEAPRAGKRTARAARGARTARGAAGAREPGRDGMSPAPLSARVDGAAARHRIGFGDLDRVLGGGLVPGSLILVAGAPGVGKSTLLLQIAARLLQEGRRVLYASGEESREQVHLRAQRLGGEAGDIEFLAATELEGLLAASDAAAPDLLCVDSIQTLASMAIDSAPGSLAQVRECAAALQDHAKRGGPAVLIAGHVTKGGALAGPRTLEHVVDVVLHFEGRRALEHRMLSATKNRFGSVDELAVFRMCESGLEAVPDPSSCFLSDRPEHMSGSAVAIPVQGTRPLLAEIQALTTPARYGTPQRVVTGLAPRRLALLLAVLERRAGLPFAERDVFVNVVGGLRLADPAVDLAIAAALASAELDRPVPAGTAYVGEVGLAGEVRAVGSAEARVRTARQAGMDLVVLPAVSRDGAGAMPGVEFMRHVRELAAALEPARAGP